VVCNLKGGFLARKVAKYGFIKRSGEFLVEPQFDDARSFKNGLAAVEVGKGGASSIARGKS
jgi:WG containing repeat